MNRLFRISFDTFLISVTPILGWFLLGILVDKHFINIFSLMFPMQYIINTIQSIFGTGANISAIRDENDKSVFSGFLFGTLIGFIILGFVILNIDQYILFMNMDVKIYKVFAIYAVGQIFLQLLLNLILCKLYYENQNKRANQYSFFFNLINFLSLVITSMIVKKQEVIASTSFLVTALFTVYIIVKTMKITGIKIHLKNCIKYDSVYLFSEITMFLIYLFGLKNIFAFGEKYILAISFASLITDTQWDMSHTVKTVAQIDITKRTFSYKEHIKNSRKFICILISSTMMMGLVLYPIYQTDLFSTAVFVGIELASLYLYPIYITRLTFIQLEYSALKATLNKQIANISRVFCSFIPSPFCLSIGVVISTIYQLFSSEYLIRKHHLQLKTLTSMSK